MFYTNTILTICGISMISNNADFRLCDACHLTTRAHHTCPRCGSLLHDRRPNSLQISAALLISAFIFLFPANLLPITQTVNQGVVSNDTIYTGILALIHADMAGIAAVVFIASILVPIIKVCGLAIILITITFGIALPRKPLTVAFHIIEFIGRWSMLDLFVISIMVSVINMGQLLYFTPGPAATYFALVVLFTQLAAQHLDTRLLWDLDKDNNE